MTLVNAVVQGIFLGAFYAIVDADSMFEWGKRYGRRCRDPRSQPDPENYLRVLRVVGSERRVHYR